MTNDISKVSQRTRTLSGTSEIAYAAFVSDLRKRFEAEDADETAIKRDALIGRLSAGLMLLWNAEHGLTGDKRLKRETFEAEAEKIVDGPSDEKRLLSAAKWFNRARTAAGYPSKDTRGGKRDPRTPVAKVAPVTEVAETPEVKALKVPAIAPETTALQIGATLRATMQKAQAANPKAFEADDFSRRTWAAMSHFMGAMKLIELDAAKVEKVAPVAKVAKPVKSAPVAELH